MQNRRQHYRHEFPPTRPISVRLESTDGVVVHGDLINLSIGGLCVYASALKKHATSTWSITLPLDTESLEVQVERAGMRAGEPERCGFRILAADDQELAEEQERRIWKFLLDAQRRRRQLQ